MRSFVMQFIKVLGHMARDRALNRIRSMRDPAPCVTLAIYFILLD
jgi:hypothetical protein